MGRQEYYLQVRVIPSKSNIFFSLILISVHTLILNLSSKITVSGYSSKP